MSKPYSTVPSKARTQPTPFEVIIPNEKLIEFKTLLELSKIAAPTYENLLEDRKYGISSKWLTETKEAWLNNFSWRLCEDRINSFPHFKLPVHAGNDHLTIHFTALFSTREDAIPVCLLHGWPGSFLEFLPMLGIMKERYSDNTLPYHFIVPSLPGYAFSDTTPLGRDFRIEDVARVTDSLMRELGFGDGYVVQGGDVGSKIARVMAAEHESCAAVHLNFGLMPEPAGVDKSSYSGLEKQGLKRADDFSRIGSAYALEHATRPSTIGLVLASNPLALLAWIGEKFLEWSDDDPSLDEILESVTLYWLTETFPRAIFPYRQLFTPGNIGAHENPIWHINKPFGFSWFPKEIAPVPRSWVQTTGNLVFWKQHTKGGHFAALERPDVLLGDLVDFIEQVWKK